MQMILKTANIIHIDSAINGYEGLNMVIKKQYDLVLCDINMPVKDGYECCQQIKSHYESNNLFNNENDIKSYCPYLVACSALITSQIEQKTIQVGFDMACESPLRI